MDGEALRNLEQVSEASYLACLGSLYPPSGVAIWIYREPMHLACSYRQCCR